MTMGCDSDLPLLAARSLAVTSRRSDFCKLRHVNGGLAGGRQRQEARAARAAGAVVQSAAVQCTFGVPLHFAVTRPK